MTQPRLPLSALLALATAGFITILTEALPAGLLPQIGADLAVSDAVAGQTVTVYAIGSLVAAIPLTVATQRMRRRPLLLAAITGFALANGVTALSPSYGLTMLARFGAGVSAGLLWTLLAGYAARLVPEAQKGRAIAVAMAGTPVALSLGIPAGTVLGGLVGWRVTFGLMSGSTLVLILWVLARLPDDPGRQGGPRHRLGAVLGRTGVRPVLVVTLAFVLAHNTLYTYVAPLLDGLGMADRTALVLAIFGAAGLIGIGLVGLLIDRHLRALTLTSIAGFAVASLGLSLAGHAAALVYGAVGLWGLAFGGAATLFQTALSEAAGDATDIAQSMLVTVWNGAIAGGGLVGGLLLDRLGADGLAPSLSLLLLPALLVAGRTRRQGVAPIVHPATERC